MLLCHGLGANRVGFDAAESVSLARFLAKEGFDAWAVELRGHGHSPRKRLAWTFDDYLRSDAPAAIDAVLAATGAGTLAWVGHSMGGILLYALLASGEKRIGAAVTIGSSLDYSASRSGFHRLVGLLPLMRLLPGLPLGLLQRASAPLALRLGGSRADRFIVWPANVDPALWRGVQARSFRAVPRGVLLQLASGFRTGGLRSADGTVRYSEGLGRSAVPVLALAGDRDQQCPPDAVKVTFEALGQAAGSKLVVCGKEAGHLEHYGHFDLLVGKRAASEVYPEILRFLESAALPAPPIHA